MKWKIENLKTVAISWTVTMILLLVGTVYNYVTENKFGIVGIIFFASLIVYFAVYIIFKNKINHS